MRVTSVCFFDHEKIIVFVICAHSTVIKLFSDACRLEPDVEKYCSISFLFVHEDRDKRLENLKTCVGKKKRCKEVKEGEKHIEV